VYDAWNPTKRGTRGAERGARSTRPQAGLDGALFSIRTPQSEIRNRPDGLGRRIRKVVEGSPDVTYDYYYNEARQVLEVWKDGDADHPLEQYVWDGRYVHSPCLRWRDGNCGIFGDIHLISSIKVYVTGNTHARATCTKSPTTGF
jgi:hypothetical protein